MQQSENMNSYLKGQLAGTANDIKSDYNGFIYNDRLYTTDL